MKNRLIKITLLTSLLILLLSNFTFAKTNLTTTQQNWFNLMNSEYINKKGIDDVRISGLTGQFQCTQVMWHYSNYIFGESLQILRGQTHRLADTASKEYFDIIKLDPNLNDSQKAALLKVGDIPVWHFKDYNYGHVAVVYHVYENSFLAVEQNVDDLTNGINQKVRIKKNNFNDIVAYLRPKKEKVIHRETVSDKALGTIIVDSKDYLYINVRSLPSTNSNIIKHTVTGDEFKYYELKNNWYKIAVNDSYAYIYADFAVVKKESGNTYDNTIRISGNNRYTTALNISNYVDKNSPKYIIASAEDFADALSGAIITNSKYPILLVSKNDIKIDVLNKLKDKEVIILGGNSAISKNVEEKIRTVTSHIKRIYGDNRYLTSIEIAKLSNKNSGAIITSGEDFADAISASSLSLKKDIPLILTAKDKIPISVKEYLKNIKGEIIITGGFSAVSKEVEEEIKKINSNTRRIYGDNRYLTSIEIAKEFGPINTTIITTGLNFPDAISASAYAGKINSPIILSDSNTVSVELRNLIKSNMPHKVNIIGGINAVSEEFEKEINKTCYT